MRRLISLFLHTLGALLKLQRACESAGGVDNCSRSGIGLRFCIPNKLPGDARAVGPETTL